MKTLSKNEWLAFVNRLITEDTREVIGVQAKGEKFVFAPLEDAKNLRLDYDVTILPPKKFFLPQYETMMKFDLSKSFDVQRAEDPDPIVIIGVHPYDIAAIRQMDSYFLDTEVSATYLKRRKSTLIIGSDVMNVSERAFFGSMGTGRVQSGYDLFITDLGDRIAIEIGTEEGARLLKYAENLEDATPVDVQKVTAFREAASSMAMRGIKVKPKGWHDLLQKNYESEVWKEQSDKCLGCGTCTLVCPTCFCYDIVDDISLDLKTAQRVRTWDGCLLRQFTAVASGEVFREDILARYRHRFNRKGNYLPDRLGFVACVGCGRCSSQCLPDIADPVQLINKLFDSTTHLVTESVMDPHSVRTEMKEVFEGDSLHVPMSATVKRVEKLTEMETLFEIEPDSLLPLGHKPGQFVEVSLMGVGEAPISVSSAPGGNTFEIVVRKVGDVTRKMHTLNPGDKVGIRGPFGNGFDVEWLKGKNLLLIAGGLGIVPMRSLFNHVTNNRQDYGEVTILYGCKTPSEMLFTDEIALLENNLLAVDECPDGEAWEGDVGVITILIPKAKFDPKDTIAVVVGPPIMYRFVIRELLSMGMPEENIIVSLERRMKCGVGKCGHCQMNGIYVCREGPVFNYRDVKDLPEAFT